jgi:NAD+ synthase
MNRDQAALFELPQELVIDTEAVRREIVDFIRTYLRQAGFQRAVLGLSGGIDSALVAYLTAEAVGPASLLCVLMPYRTSSTSSVEHARLVVDRLGCPSDLVEISPMVDAYFGREREVRVGDSRDVVFEMGAGGPAAREAPALRRGNLAARMRMSVLYDRSVMWGGLVAGTGNKTEWLIGYTTMYGDNACAFNPVGGLYKTQVRQLAAAIGVPEEIIRKAPSADLWPGQTDEGEGGFNYPELDRLLYWMVDRKRSDADLVAMGFSETRIKRVKRSIASSEFKRRLPPVAIPKSLAKRKRK